MKSDLSKPWPRLTSRDEFAFLANLVFRHSAADHVLVSIEDRHSGTARFANSQITQQVDVRTVAFVITVAFDQRHGTASTTDLTAGAVQATLKRAEALAKAAPVDPEYLPPPGAQAYPSWPTFEADTAETGPSERLHLAHTCIARCEADSHQAAGMIATTIAQMGVAANSGLFAFEPRTEAQFSITASRDDASGWAAARHRAIHRLAVVERTEEALATAKRMGIPRNLPAGRYQVVLAPPAVAGLLNWVIKMLDAKAYEKGISPFRGKLGQPIIDERLTLRNDPGHPDLLGVNFTREGLPVEEALWIDKGQLRQLAYDRFTAYRHGLKSLPTLDAPLLSGQDPVATTNELVASITRGMWISNFWYIRPVNLTDLTLTGMTRDGTFLIEDGQIVAPVRNFRFQESPLRAFNRLDAFTEPREATTSETGKLLVPAMTIRDFHFSSVSWF